MVDSSGVEKDNFLGVLGSYGAGEDNLEATGSSGVGEDNLDRTTRSDISGDPLVDVEETAGRVGGGGLRGSRWGMSASIR